MPDEMITKDWTEEEVQYLDDYFKRVRKSAAHNVVLMCKGHNCEIAHKCPLIALGKKTPVGSPCPIETHAVEQMTKELVDDLGINPDNAVDMAQVGEIVRFALLEMRADIVFANSTVMTERVAGFDADGAPIFQDQLNPIFSLYEKTSKAKEKLRASLIATREAKSKDKSRESMSMAQLIETVMSKAAEHKRALPQTTVKALTGPVSEKAIDVDWEEIGVVE